MGPLVPALAITERSLLPMQPARVAAVMHLLRRRDGAVVVRPYLVYLAQIVPGPDG